MSITGEPTRVLILDDVPADAALVERELRHGGLDLITRCVETEPEFVAALAEFRPDIVLSDYSLPSFNGMDALQLVQQYSPATPLIIVTGSLTEETAAACIQAGAADYVLKEHLARLLPAVRSALERRRLGEDTRRAEEALRESESQLRAMFELASIGIAQADPRTGRWLRVNQKMCAITGYTEEELLGLHVPDITDPDDRKEDWEAFQRVVKSETPDYRLEKRYVRKDGSVVWVNVNMTVLRDRGGQPVRTIATIEDITERKRTEEALRQSEARFKAAFASSPIGMALVAPDGRHLEVNSAFCQIVGYSEEEVLATTFQELTHPDDLDLDLAHVRQLLAGEIPTYRMEKRYLHKQGHGVWVLLSVALVRDRAGLPLYFVSQVEDITASKAAVQALRESEERFRLIAENTADVIWMLDVATRRLTYVSPSVEKLRGFTAEEVLAQPFEAGLTPASLRRVDAYLAAGLAALAAGDQSASNAIVEAEMSTKDGGTVQTEVVASALTDASGRVTGVLGVTRDVSERKRAEAALQGSEERYRSLFEQSPLGIYRTTPDGRILDANPALMQMLGYASLEELRSRNLEESGFQPEYRRQAFKDAIEREGEVRGFEAIWTRNDGSRLHVRQSARAVRDAYGETLHYEGAVEDVTERKRTEESLRLRDSALTATANAVVITDTDMRIEWVNPAFTQLTGYDLEDVRGQNQRFHSGEQDAAFYEELQRTVQSGSVWHGELLNRRKDGALYSEEMTITPVRGTSGTIAHFVAVKQDITERRRLEEQLRQSQRMEAVGQLASGVAHDFNNLLQAMLSLTQMLVAHHSDPERLQADATELDHLVRRGAALTRQLLLFSRREPVRLERLDLNEVVRDGVTMLRRLLKAHVAIETFFAEGQLPVEADRGQLGQVLMNLAVNAGDAMPDGGRLAIETGSEGPMVWLKITDTGGGIPAAIRDHIFEPFFTTKGQGKGTGLGLSVVHGIITQHGGAVTLECQEGQGTTFTVILPRAGSGERPAEELAERADVSPRGHGELVLVVEDEESARQSLADILTMLGYQVTAVGSGEEAGRLAPERPFDLLLTDLMLPGITGGELASGLVARWPDLRVVLMSGYTEDEAVVLASRTTAVRFLQKPFDMDALARELRAALADTAQGEGARP